MSIHERMERLKRAQAETETATEGGVTPPSAAAVAPASPAAPVIPAAPAGAASPAAPVTPAAPAGAGAPAGPGEGSTTASSSEPAPIEASADAVVGAPVAPGHAEAGASAVALAAGPEAVPQPPAPVRETAVSRTGAPLPPRTAVRDDRLREVRVEARAEAAKSSNSLSQIGDSDLRERIEPMVDRVVGQSRFAVTRDERERLVEDMLAEIQGLGPIEPYLKDDTITEVMVNGAGHIYIERRGKIERTDAVFLNDAHVMQVIDRIVTPIGRRIDQSSPRVDARLADGSRVNVIIEPLSLIGPVITIRKFSRRPYTVADLVGFGTASAEMFDFLRACVEGRLNVFVSGGTGSGKTTTLNVLSSFIPNDERIITIEDAAELPAQPGPCRHARGAAGEPRGEGRDHDPGPAQERPAHASGPHHRGRVPRRRGPRHDPGDEHRARSLALHRPREQPGGHAPADRDDGPHGRRRPAAPHDPRADHGGRRHHRAHRRGEGWHPEGPEHHRGVRDRGRRHPHAGRLPVRADRHA